jgi:ComEC/Rec2-related protein
VTRLPATRATVRASLLAVAFGGGVSWGAVAGGPWLLAPALLALAIGSTVLALACNTQLRRPLLVGSLMVAAVAGGLLRGVSSASPNVLSSAAGIDRGPVVIQGTVREAPARHHSESLVVVDVDVLTDAAGTSRPHIAVIAAVPGPVVALPGDHVRVDASGLRPPSVRPGPESAATLDREGVAAVAVSPRVTVTASGAGSLNRWIAQVRGRLSAAAAQALPEPAATLVDEFALGVRGTLPTDVSTPLQDAGLIHLVATSGLKVALLIALLLRVLAVVAAPPRLRVTVVLLVTAAYVAVSGAGPAAMRAAVMAAVALMAGPSGRRTQPLALLTVVGALMLAVSPRLCLDVGFQLSFLGTTGILLLADPICRHLPGPRLVAEPIGVTVAAQLATFPVMASAFGVVSLVGPLANGLAVPALPVLLGLGWCGALLAQLNPLLGWLPLQLAGLIAGLILEIARATSAVPLAAIHVGMWPHAWLVAEMTAVLAGATAIVVYKRWGGSLPAPPARPDGWAAPSVGVGRAGVVIAAVLSAAIVAGAELVAAARPDGRLHLSVLSVGAASAVLVTTPDGGLVLVDGGSDPQRLAQAVGSSLAPTVRTIDVLIITGGERGAVAGVAGLHPHYDVSHVVAPDTDLSSGAATLLGGLRAAGADLATAASPWSWGGLAWRFVCAGPGTTSQGSAVPACALQLAGAGGSALLLGDVASAEQEELAGLFGESLAADLVVAPPGGALAPALVDATRPHHVAVPSARAVRAAASLGAVALRSTGADGTLDYVGSGGGLVAA